MDQAAIDKVKALEITTLEDLEQLKKTYMQKVRDEGQTLIKQEFASFFAANPLVRVVAWTQYTPYFNDGDTCTFSVHDMYGGSRDLTPSEIAEIPKYVEHEPELGFVSAGGYRDDSAEGESFKRYGTQYNKAAGYPLDAAKAAQLDQIDEAVGKLSGRLYNHEDLMKMAFGDHVQVIATPAGFTVNDIEHD